MRKLNHALQAFCFKAPSKLCSQLFTQAGHELSAILRTLTTQHFSGQALANAPVQASQLRIDRTGQALAAVGNERAQFGVQVVSG